MSQAARAAQPIDRERALVQAGSDTVKLFTTALKPKFTMPVTRPSLTLTLLQAREAAMSFFRPLLNQHGLTEQQWRVIRILRQHGEMESYRLAELACILKPSMTGVLSRLERDGLVSRSKPPHACRSCRNRQFLVMVSARGNEPQHSAQPETARSAGSRAH